MNTERKSVCDRVSARVFAVALLSACCSGAGAQSAAPGVIGALTKAPDNSAPSLAATQRAALSVAIGSRTQLIYEPSLWRPQDVPATALNRDDADAHLALQFRSTRGSSPRNLLRVQLSGGGVMQFKPRGGGMTVRYQVQF